MSNVLYQMYRRVENSMGKMTEDEALAELGRLEQAHGPMTQAERRHFENLLTLRAHVAGWTGDPLCQPASVVLAAYRQMRAEKVATTDPARSGPGTSEPPLRQRS
jgi:hypothetical protein